MTITVTDRRLGRLTVGQIKSGALPRVKSRLPLTSTAGKRRCASHKWKRIRKGNGRETMVNRLCQVESRGTKNSHELDRDLPCGNSYIEAPLFQEQHAAFADSLFFANQLAAIHIPEIPFRSTSSANQISIDARVVSALLWCRLSHPGHLRLLRVQQHLTTLLLSPFCPFTKCTFPPSSYLWLTVILLRIWPFCCLYRVKKGPICGQTAQGPSTPQVIVMC